MTSSSRIDPPGWITAVAPASMQASMPSANGKNASDATTEPLVSGSASFSSAAASCALRAAMRAEFDPAHLAGADADGREILGIDDGVRLHVLGDAEGEHQVAHLVFRRRPFGRNLQHHVVDHGIVAALHQQSTGNSFGGEADRARIGQAAGEQQPQIAPLGDHGNRVFGRIGRDNDLGEDFGDRLRGLRIQRLVQCDDAAIGRGRVAGERAEIGGGEIGPFGDAARVGVLDDHAGRGPLRIEFGDAFERRIGIVDVVVGQLLALQLAQGRNARPLVGQPIERGLLVRVLAIAQRLDQAAAEGAEVRRLGVELVREPVRDRGVIGRGTCIGFRRKAPAQRKRGCALIGVELVEHGLIVAGFDHHGDIVMVLCGGADHRGSADVDILDALLEAGAFVDGRLEGIEVDHQEIDRRDAMRLHRLRMLFIVADREQAAMHFRMQRLDAAVHHLGKTGQL